MNSPIRPTKFNHGFRLLVLVLILGGALPAHAKNKRRKNDSCKSSFLGFFWGGKNQSPAAEKKIGFTEKGPTPHENRPIRVEEKLLKKQEEEAKKVAGLVRTQMGRPGRPGEVATELAVAEAVLTQMREPGRKVVSILMDGEALTPEQVSAVEAYKNKGYSILYDAESNLGPVIARLAGPSGLGIKSKGKGIKRGIAEGHEASIGNSYLRLKVFSEADEVIASPQSTTGVAMLPIYKLGKLFDPKFKSVGTLHNWQSNVEGKFGLGVEITKHPLNIRSVKELEKELKEKAEGNGKPFVPNVESYLASRKNPYPLELLLETQNVLLKGESELEGNNKKTPGGAVVFGSSQLHPAFAELVYNVGRKLAKSGIPVATGGSGGFMFAANAGAFDAGGISQGINIKNTALKKERQTMNDVHSQTIFSNGYETRIPLLLHRRQLVVFAPGGNGTMRELGAALIDMAANPERKVELVFLDSNYYRPLINHLKQALPEKAIRRLHVIDKVEELDPIIKRIEERLGDGKGQFRSNGNVVARNKYTSINDRPVPQPPPPKTGKGNKDSKSDGKGILVSTIPTPPAWASKDKSPLRDLFSPELKEGKWYQVNSKLSLKVEKKIGEAGWDRRVYRAVDNKGKTYVLKLPSSKAPLPVEKITSDASRAKELAELGIKHAPLVYFDGYALVREWTHGTRGDEWLRDWEKKGYPKDDPGIVGIADYLAQTSKLGAYVGKVDPEDAMITKGGFVVVDSGGITKKLKRDDVLERHFDKMGSRWGAKLKEPHKFLKVVKKVLKEKHAIEVEEKVVEKKKSEDKPKGYVLRGSKDEDERLYKDYLLEGRRPWRDTDWWD